MLQDTRAPEWFKFFIDGLMPEGVEITRDLVVDLSSIVSSIGALLSIFVALYIFGRNQRIQRLEAIRFDLAKMIEGTATVKELSDSDRFFAVETRMLAEMRNRLPANVDQDIFAELIVDEDFRKGLNRAATAAILAMPEWKTCYESVNRTKELSAKHKRVLPIFGDACADLVSYNEYLTNFVLNHNSLWSAWDGEDSGLREVVFKRMDSRSSHEEISLAMAELYIDYCAMAADYASRKSRLVSEFLRELGERLLLKSDRQILRLSKKAVKVAKRNPKLIDEKDYIQDVLNGVERYQFVLSGRERAWFKRSFALLVRTLDTLDSEPDIPENAL